MSNETSPIFEYDPAWFHVEFNNFDIQLTKPDVKPPSKSTDGASGYDIYSNESYDLYPGEIHAFHTGVKMAIPKDVGGFILPRSGLGSKGLHLANVIGLIDSDYRGEIVCKLKNNSDQVFNIKMYDKIAQMVLIPTLSFNFNIVDNLDTTERGEGGFGSTG
jgi:dUTP pyrophosphatase